MVGRTDPERPAGRVARAGALLGLAGVLLSGCWFQPGWGPGRTGSSPVEDRLTVANVATLTEVWSADLGAGAVLDPIASMHGVHVVAGNTLRTLRLETGAVRWTVTVRQLAPGDTIGSPSLQQARGQLLVPVTLFAGTDVNGLTHTFDPGYGTAGEVEDFGVNGSFTVDGTAIAGVSRWLTGPNPEDAVGDILSFDDVAGQSWSTPLGIGSPANIPRSTTVALGDGLIVFGRGSDAVAYRRTAPEGCTVSCPPVWSYGADGAVTVPVLADSSDTAYVGDSSGSVAALDTDDGSPRWVGDTDPEGVVATPTLGAGHLYVTTRGAHLYAFDADCQDRSCEPRWQADTGSAVEKQAALAAGVVYVASDDGTISAFDASGCGGPVCDPLWTASTGSRITGAPILANGHLLVGTEDGRVVAYRPS
jgi:outer membrane protein assembly factor BamB